MEKKVKSILFKIRLAGKGIVNFDSNSQRFVWNQLKGKEICNHENVNFAKKNWYVKNGELSYKIKISSDCLRKQIFDKDVACQSPNIINSKELLLVYLANPALILRGYLFAEKEITLKKKSAFTITDAEQTNNSISMIETFSKSGQKVTDENLSDNSFFKKETVGDMEYDAAGFVDLRELQFLSCDQIFDRLSIEPDYFTVYKNILKTKMPSFKSEMKYYQLKDSVNRIPEFGVLFSEQDVLFLVKEFFKRLLNLKIHKSKAFADIIKIEYKMVYDCTEDTLENNDSWNTIKSLTDIEDINFVPELFFEEENEKNAEAIRKELVEAAEIKKQKNKEEKDRKAAERKRKKEEKTVVVSNEKEE